MLTSLIKSSMDSETIEEVEEALLEKQQQELLQEHLQKNCWQNMESIL